MKFEFVFDNSDKEIIDINFNFMVYSELIKSLEPDEDDIIFITEKFYKYQVLVFKELMEKIGRIIDTKEISSLSEDEIDLFHNSILGGITDYFLLKNNKEFSKHIPKKHYYIHKMEMPSIEMWRPFREKHQSESFEKLQKMYPSLEDKLISVFGKSENVFDTFSQLDFKLNREFRAKCPYIYRYDKDSDTLDAILLPGALSRPCYEERIIYRIVKSYET